ncbi:MAG: S-methyl-5'-thioadenosine phosphorylase [Candidatus Hydrothermarchaeota archaeon]
MAVGIIGGTGVDNILKDSRRIEKNTPYGRVTILEGKLSHRDSYLIFRHGEKQSIPPHRVNYRANLWGLKEVGVDRIIAFNAVGSLNEQMKPGDFVLIDDFFDFTRSRKYTFYETQSVHVDMTEPYCPEMREIVLKKIDKIHPRGVYLCTEGPRFETVQEIKVFKLLGCDVVGMTGVPEVILARELGLCYISICTVTNLAAGISKEKLTAKEVLDIMEKKKDEIKSILEKIVPNIPVHKKCGCSTVPKNE